MVFVATSSITSSSSRNIVIACVCAFDTTQRGENMKQLTEVRRVLEKELGHEACKRIRTPILALDVLLVSCRIIPSNIEHT